MYLRTTKRTNEDGSVVTYYQLAHNERDPVTRKPVAKIIHSLGRDETQGGFRKFCPAKEGFWAPQCRGGPCGHP